MIVPAAVAALSHVPAASSVSGFAPEEVTWWWMAVGLGLVVVLVVIGVLTLLIRLVQDIDRGVEGVVETLGQTARNTGTSFLIADTAAQVDAVLAEGLNHHLFLTRVLSGSGKKAVPR
jgi:hypothetical protein